MIFFCVLGREGERERERERDREREGGREGGREGKIHYVDVHPMRDSVYA